MSAFQVVAVQPTARMGLKGFDAAALLQQAGITVPSAPNRIAANPHMRVLRLGNTEFILEQDDGDSAIAQVNSLARTAGLRAWPVTRADCSLLISGNGIFDRLSRVCAFDFTQLDATPDLAVMTLLADISVTFTLEPASGPRCLRLWADPGFATYLTLTLQSLSPDAPSHGVHP
jgi:sarcosine oxidase gamma subunit